MNTSTEEDFEQSIAAAQRDLEKRERHGRAYGMGKSRLLQSQPSPKAAGKRKSQRKAQGKARKAQR